MVGLKKFLYTITQKLSSRQNTRIRKIKKGKRETGYEGDRHQKEKERERERTV